MLKFRPDGSFTIVQFTDIHFQNGEPEDHLSLQLMNAVLDRHPPDLVVFTGDVIFASTCQNPRESFSRAVSPAVKRRLPWAVVFGNHDDEGISRADLMQHCLTLPGNLAVPGPDEISGVGNYVLTVHRMDESPAVALFFMDSHAYANRFPKQYDWIKPDQIDWYRTQSKSPSNSHALLPALLFMHIPLPEYETVWETGNCLGEKNEPVCCPRYNSGLFEAMKTSGNVQAIFCGHDHTNDFAGVLDGIHLIYGRATGYNAYGREGFQRGARLIHLKIEGTFQTEVCFQ